MVTIYRPLRKAFSSTPIDGEGCFRFGGRRSRPEARVVYTAEHLSLAMIECLAHLDADRPPTDLMLATADIPDDVSTLRFIAADLPSIWRNYPVPDALPAVGDRFAQELQACALIVPSGKQNHGVCSGVIPILSVVTPRSTERLERVCGRREDRTLLRSCTDPRISAGSTARLARSAQGLPEGSCLYQYTRVISGFDRPRQDTYGNFATEGFLRDRLTFPKETAAFRRIDPFWCPTIEPA